MACPVTGKGWLKALQDLQGHPASLAPPLGAPPPSRPPKGGPAGPLSAVTQAIALRDASRKPPLGLPVGPPRSPPNLGPTSSGAAPAMLPAGNTDPCPLRPTCPTSFSTPSAHPAWEAGSPGLRLQAQESSWLCLPRPATDLPVLPRRMSVWVFPAESHLSLGPGPPPWTPVCSLPGVPVLHRDLWAQVFPFPCLSSPLPAAGPAGPLVDLLEVGQGPGWAPV